MMPPEIEPSGAVCAWLRVQPVPLTFDDLAARLAARFGPASAVSPAALRAWWLRNRIPAPALRLQASEPRGAFILARLGLRPDAAILAEVTAAFPDLPAPKRTTFYRFCAAQRAAAGQGVS